MDALRYIISRHFWLSSQVFGFFFFFVFLFLVQLEVFILLFVQTCCCFSMAFLSCSGILL